MSASSTAAFTRLYTVPAIRHPGSMFRTGIVGIALAIIGCGGSHTLDDAGAPEGIDAATERADTGGEPAADAGTDAGEANDDSGAWGAMFRLPFSTCEFCPGTPSGMIPGSHGHDAGPDAFTSDAAAVAP